MNKTVVLPVLALAFTVATTIPSYAEEPKTPPSWEDSQKMLEQGAQRVIGALELLLQAIPQYELPEVLPNGDILIRRKNQSPETPKKETESDRT